MQNKKHLRWPKVTLLAGSFSIILGFLVVPQVQAQATTPTPNCNTSRTSCTIAFPYAGDYYQWTPPADVRTMTMAMAGAQGGRTGGTGSKTNATFKTIPTTPLYIYVGGQGSSGNAAAGGYNGGGTAGSGHGDEGSGGGATDIRTSTLVTDRIAVAGGGGGTGGWVGAAGGSGLSTTGNPGANGQGLGGGGGTPTAGGLGGASNGVATTAGLSGSLGQGGTGGSANSPGSTVAGGAGGGGGYYGGGGGGADTDPTGVDGGGGGAGSSYTNSTRFQSVQYTAAWQSGDGYASITYNFGPSVTSFTAPSSPSNKVSPVFNIVFGQSVTGLTADDFTISGTATGCYVSLLTGSGASYAATVNGCADGTISLTLKADTVFGNAIGPVRTVSTTPIILDRTLPEVNTLIKQASTNDLVVYKVTFTETVTGLAPDNTDWLVKGDGCILQSMSGTGLEYTITIANCLDGHLAGLVLNSLAVIDTAGNIGPSLGNQTPVIKIDTSAPIFHVTDVTAPGVGSTPTWVFDSEEPTTGMLSTKFAVSGTSTGCSMNYSVLRTGLGWQVTLVGCSVGTTQVTLQANAVSDLAGNLGPQVALASNVVNVTPDEIVNQSIAAPVTGQGVSVDSNAEKAEPEVKVTKEVVNTVAKPDPVVPDLKDESKLVLALPVVDEELQQQGNDKLVLSKSQQDPLLWAALLVALAIAMISFSAGSSIRNRRRRH